MARLQPVFPRQDAKPAIEKMQELEQIEKDRQAALLGNKPSRAGAISRRADSARRSISMILAKWICALGEVKQAERVKGADKLLHLKVDIGEAGTAHHRGGNRAGLSNRKS